MKYFGFTNNGDPSLNFSWLDNINSVDGIVVMSKGVGERFEDALVENSGKIIYHATCTGLGGTRLEPNVPPVSEKFSHIGRLLKKGFPVSHIVLRVDPLMPLSWTDALNGALCIDYVGTLKKTLDSACALGIRRVKYSHLKVTKTIEKALKSVCAEFAYSAYDSFADLSSLNPSLSYEACCSSSSDQSQCVGCISDIDTEILGMKREFKLQRSKNLDTVCQCPDNRLEMLFNGNKFDCSFGCVYCYLKDYEHTRLDKKR